MTDRALKAQIRAELFRCAIAGEFLTYTQFFNRIAPVQRWATFHIKHTSMKSQKRNGITVIPTLFSSCIGAGKRLNFRLRLIFARRTRLTTSNSTACVRALMTQSLFIVRRISPILIGDAVPRKPHRCYETGITLQNAK